MQNNKIKKYILLSQQWINVRIPLKLNFKLNIIIYRIIKICKHYHEK